MDSAAAPALPRNLLRYIVAFSWPHQLPLVALTVASFLFEVVPLELQRRIVNDAVKNRQFGAITVLCAIYAGAVITQGGTKLAMNVYRGWISESAKGDLRRRVYAALDGAAATAAQSESDGTAISIVVAEVEPVGGFVGTSVSEPLLQCGVLATVLAYILHLDAWMGAAALALFVPQLAFVPLMQHAMNRRTRIRIWLLRQLGGGILAAHDAPPHSRNRIDAARIDRVLQLNMGIVKIKFTMNFLMNVCSHLQIIAALLIGSWLVLHQNLEIGGVVAFISGVGRLNDPWGDLVNYFRDASLNWVKYGLLAGATATFGEAAGDDPRILPAAVAVVAPQPAK